MGLQPLDKTKAGLVLLDKIRLGLRPKTQQKTGIMPLDKTRMA